MIFQISGQASHIDDGFVVVTTGGLGYRIFMTPDAIAEVAKPVNQQTRKNVVTLWTHHVIREDFQELFGFFTKAELNFFEMLLKVSGVGPKSALSIMSVAPIETLREAIARGETSYLVKVSGIGKKTAEKVIVELKDRISATGDKETAFGEDIEVLEALRALGYSAEDGRSAIKKLPAEIVGVQNRIRETLRLLSSRSQ